MGKLNPVLAAVLLASPLIRAQNAAYNWDNLGRLRAGQKIEVVDTKMKSTQCRFAGYSGSGLLVRTGTGEMSIPRTQVFSIKDREHSGRGRNILLGLGIGAAAGFAIGAVKGKTYHEAGETGVFIAVFTPIGAGAGTLAGAVLPARQVTVYRASPEKPRGEPNRP